MDQLWRCKFLSLPLFMILAVLFLLLQNVWALNTEGLALLRFRDRVTNDLFGSLSNWKADEGNLNPCSWFGVECSDGNVVSLNLKDLCLEGTLAPELGQLTYMKSIILRNNSFSGNIPKEISKLKELEVLDLGYNNFSGSFPSDLGNKLSLSILLLDNNEFLGNIYPKLDNLKTLSKFQVDKHQLNSAPVAAGCSSRCTYWNSILPGRIARQRLLQVAAAPISADVESSRHKRQKSIPPSSSSLSLSPSESIFVPSLSPSVPPLSSISLPPLSSLSFPPVSPSSSPPLYLAPAPLAVQPPNPANPPTVVLSAPKSDPVLSTNPASIPTQSKENNSKSKHRTILLSVVVGGSAFLLTLVVSIVCHCGVNVVTVKPWATGLSGQLQKAFVTGVPKLQRSELETACEDFSNIIGSIPGGTVYKGTLSTGVEIAVISTLMKSNEEWPKNLEAQFRTKIDALSKVNHKNFLSLIGFCEEQKPFTRMMVFEYAPNGTLFEHLHVKEAEHLDRGTRLRIAMGMAYCLEYMHELSPPLAHRNLQSSSVYLTEDYAAKISDFSFWKEVTAEKIGSATMERLDSPRIDLESNVYSFGVLLFEMITGKLPYSVDNSSQVDWASDYLRVGVEQPLRELVESTLKSFKEEELEKLSRVVKDCVHPDPKQRPRMKEVTARLRDITTIGPDGATPKQSPLWWAELEILSS